MHADHPMLAKIRKLLAKAENDASTPEEAELYTAKAATLIADYGIDQALLAAEVPQSDVVGDRVVHLEAPYARDKADLLSAVAVRLRCRAVHMTDRTPDGKRFAVHLFGHESDLARADLLFTSLLMQASTWLSRTPVPAWDHKAAFRRSWLAGFRLAISRRLETAERLAETGAAGRAAAAGRSMGLVLADRSLDVARAVTDTYPRLGTARPRQLSGSGLPGGYAAGQRADLGGSRLGSDQDPALLP
ncbi:DUF2786 domain-containing protein [Nocardioides sp. Root151]|uniref:DUF2786 domain-containing protein n=1 Tax=Nocardioides sp. Root151 TaxID=1736475 RepID=UPI0007035438|nr:DUF2786 domain-containing protein [Nocardioides sp. Root151]KQZ75361.1 hypothetical protein ASD66_03080 [Nocardioides sp. Root151]